MTLYDAEKDGAFTPRHATGPGPKTHAIIIGVGYYHHLPGGGGDTVKDSMDLEQLTSPPESAKAFAKWVVEDLNNPKAPLASVELLTSPPMDFVLPNGTTRQSTRASMSEIQQAFGRWYQRCDSDAGNVAIFYFCGHGVMRRNLALLAEDYGMLPLVPFQTAVDLDVTWEGLARCKAETQCFFIDSCRQATWVMQKQLNDPAVPLITSEFGGGTDRDAPRFMATGPGRSAYGMSGGVTLFTGVLLECLKRGALNMDGRWVVTTLRLSEAISRAMQELRENSERPQIGSTAGTMKGNTIHELLGPPEIPVSLCCRPETATEHAKFELFVSTPPRLPRFSRKAPAPHRWDLIAPAGHYTARATFTDKKYKAARHNFWVDPPGPVNTKISVGS